MNGWSVMALGLCAGCASPPVQPAPVVWHCTRVIDGDTLVAERSDRPGEPEHIRLYGIDAPERNLPGGAQATAALRALATGRELHFVSHGKDKYGRLLDEVSVNGHDLSQTLLQEGLAVPYSGGKRDPQAVSDAVVKNLH